MVKYQAEQLREGVLLHVELGDSETLGTRMAQQWKRVLWLMAGKNQHREMKGLDKIQPVKTCPQQ